MLLSINLIFYLKINYLKINYLKINCLIIDANKCKLKSKEFNLPKNVSLYL